MTLYGGLDVLHGSAEDIGIYGVNGALVTSAFDLLGNVDRDLFASDCCIFH